MTPLESPSKITDWNLWNTTILIVWNAVQAIPWVGFVVGKWLEWTKTISPNEMKSKNSSSNPSFPFGLKDLIPYTITDEENGFLFRVPKPNWKKKVYSVLASTKLLDQMICILSSINYSIISTNVISEVTSFF